MLTFQSSYLKSRKPSRRTTEEDLLSSNRLGKTAVVMGLFNKDTTCMAPVAKEPLMFLQNSLELIGSCSKQMPLGARIKQAWQGSHKTAAALPLRLGVPSYL
ncbi:hypothetical protein CDL15_Pgr001131 [Punica granatum]|uniref:Uncharacterized protein n=1 Tax=Punica granatum TaxID=22663 RepID=A0A218WJK6_PUNGR|nr:hypothetical protein CDL15_Pgr001131 [Punica granatum]